MENLKAIRSENNSITISDDVVFGPNCELTFNETPTKNLSINNSITIEAGARFRHCRIIIRGHNNIIFIGKNTFYTGTIMIEGSNRRVTIGENCTVNGMFITCRDEDIIIGNDCLISSDVKIRSSDSHKIYSLDTNEIINKPKNPVVIEDHVWIGQDVFIGKNSLVSKGSIVAARATVTKKITEQNCIIAEYSKIIKRNIRWEK